MKCSRIGRRGNYLLLKLLITNKSGACSLGYTQHSNVFLKLFFFYTGWNFIPLKKRKITCFKASGNSGNRNAWYLCVISIYFVKYRQTTVLDIVLSDQYITFLIFCWPCISIYLFTNINQLDALNFVISLFQASKCFEHMCSSSGGQNCIIQSLVSSHLWHQRLYNTIFSSWPLAHVLETCRGLK